MGSSSEQEEEDPFFDSREDISSVSDSSSDCAETSVFSGGTVDWVSGYFRYEIWVEKPASIRERRDKFLRWMGLDQRTDSPDLHGHIAAAPEIDRLVENSGAVLRSSDSDSFSSIRSSISSCLDGFPNLSEDRETHAEAPSPDSSWGNLVCRIKNLDDGTEFVIDELGQDGMLSRLREVGSDRLVTMDEFQRNLGLSSSVQRFMRRDNGETSNFEELTKKKKSWLRRLKAVACIVKRQGEGKLKSNDPETAARVAKFLKPTLERPHRVKVRHCRKHSKEFSALYMAQDIQAHMGSILTMKFSLDGRYLASAGEDGLVRVWQVLESAGTDSSNIPDADSSCIYFMVNNSSELVPLFVNKEKLGKFGNLRKCFDSACIIIPPKIFRISEKPVHEFRGHSGDVLDLSWSKTKYLLSSSTDKTVRLWQVGHSQCLKVFSHNNYVTCIQFNPVDDNYFISGSIDGKVRIWAIPGCQVVDWIDIREIVSAVCYHPDGQGGIIGSMAGNCRFYDASGNHLQLDAEISLQGKKKSPCKRITGFQFAPGDPSKVMVTSADSQVRILDGVDVICKYRGLRNAGSQISASFTWDGKHIVSASEDSHVYVWNYRGSPNGSTPNRVKSVWSCERFFSSNASVAIPWSGSKCGTPDLGLSETAFSHREAAGYSLGSSSENGNHDHWDSAHSTPLSLSSPDRFSPSQRFFSELLPKASATWPEEKLPASSSLSISSSLCKSQYKFLKNACQNITNSPRVWGLVIVTAGWDGRIRTFHNYGLPVRV